MPRPPSLVANAGYMVGARVLTQALRLVYLLVLARLLGPELFGLYAYGFAWYQVYIPLALLGVGEVLSLKVGADRGRGGEYAARTLALRALITLAATSLCGGLGWWLNPEPAVRSLLVVFSLALAGRAFAAWTEHCFVAFETARYALRQEAIFRPLEVAVGLGVLALGGGPLEVAAVHAAGWWLQAGVGLALVHRRVVVPRLRLAFHGLGELLRMSLPIGLSNLCIIWLLHGPVVLFRQYAEDTAGLGRFALVMQILGALCTLAMVAAKSALPELSRRLAAGRGGGERLAARALQAAVLAGAAAGLAGMGLGPWVVGTLFGPGYAPAGTLLGPALWLLVPVPIAQLTTQLMLAQGRPLYVVGCALAGAATLTLGATVLAGAWGAAGAIAAAGGGFLVWTACLLAASTTGRALARELRRPLLGALSALGVYVGLSCWGAALGLASAALVLSATIGIMLRGARVQRR